MELNLYCVSDRYIEYLRKFDYRIYDNKRKQEHMKENMLE